VRHAIFLLKDFFALPIIMNQHNSRRERSTVITGRSGFPYSTRIIGKVQIPDQEISTIPVKKASNPYQTG